MSAPLILALPSTMRSTASPPRPASIKAPSPPTPVAGASADPKAHDDDRTMASPPPPPKLPEVAPTFSPPMNPSTTTTTNTTQAPAQLALLLSNALADADALRRALSEEKKRAARAERLLSSLHPSAGAENGISDEQKSEHMSEGALKAVLDAEARAERAERARDDAVHAVHSLMTQFADLERYEASLSLRAADARGAFARLLATIAASHPPPAASPTLSGGGSGSPSTLILPGLPPPLPAPSANIMQAQYLSGPGAPPPPPPPPPPSSSAPRYSRGLPPSQASFSFGYASPSYSHGAAHARQNSHTHSATFSSLPLPPPPTASGLGASLIGGPSAPPTSSSSSFSVPAKRAHRSRSNRGLDDGAGGESGIWEESKRRRVGAWDMDVDEPGMAHASQVEQHLPYPQHQPPLSAHPFHRYERERGQQEHQSFAGNGAYPARYEEREMRGAGSVNGHGLGRVDARELVRDAKERERRGRSSHYRSRARTREGEGRKRRSASRSSAASSWSIDEMLLETATDGDRERREDGRPSPVGTHHEQPVLGQYQSHVFTPSVSGPPPLPSSNAPPLQGEPSYVDHSPKKASSHSSQASSGSIGGVNGAGERERVAKVPATQLVTLGPGGVVVSGGGPATSMPGGSFPAQNTSGQRICRQCGVPGRYKDGKCVEKWGPGPEGPGTVCDRCRKKMKRVERRGTLDSSAASAQQQAFLAHRQSQNQSQNHLQAHPTLPAAPTHSPSHGRSRAAVRTDTLLIDQNGHPHSQTQSTMLSPSPRPSQQHAYSRERERSRDGRSREGSSRSHSPVPPYHPSASAGSMRDGQASTHYSQSQSQSQSHSQGHRRAPTPPYITSISTRDQYDDDDGDGEEDIDENGRDGGAELDIDTEIARAASAAKGTKNASRNTVVYPPPSIAVRVAPNGTVYPPAPVPSSSRASSTSTSAFERRSGSKKTSRGPGNGAANSSSKRLSLPSTTVPRPARRRDLQDELDEDDADGDADADADGSGDADADADAEIMDAVDAAMKVED